MSPHTHTHAFPHCIVNHIFNAQPSHHRVHSACGVFEFSPLSPISHVYIYIYIYIYMTLNIIHTLFLYRTGIGCSWRFIYPCHRWAEMMFILFLIILVIYLNYLASFFTFGLPLKNKTRKGNQLLWVQCQTTCWVTR